MRLNGTAGGLAEAPEYRVVERRIMHELTALNDRQNGYIAEMMAFEPVRDSESGHLGGLAGDLAFVRRNATREAALLNGMRAPVITSSLLADAREAAARQQVTLREWIEGTLRRYLNSGGLTHLPRETERVRARLQQGPANNRTLAKALGMTRRQVSNALAGLRKRSLAHYTGPHGSRDYPWISLEE